MSPRGRPEIGTPINIRLGDELLAAIDVRARRHGKSRAEAIRILLTEAMSLEMWAVACTPTVRMNTENRSNQCL